MRARARRARVRRTRLAVRARVRRRAHECGDALDGPPLPVLRGVRRALRAGGRFVGELGGAGNVATFRAALHAALAVRGYDPEARDPWTFPTTDDFAAALRAADFSVVAIELFARPTPLPTGVSGWLETFAGSFVAGLPNRERNAIFAGVAARLDPQPTTAHQPYVADYVRLRFVASAGRDHSDSSPSSRP